MSDYKGKLEELNKKKDAVEQEMYTLQMEHYTNEIEESFNKAFVKTELVQGKVEAQNFESKYIVMVTGQYKDDPTLFEQITYGESVRDGERITTSAMVSVVKIDSLVNMIEDEDFIEAGDEDTEMVGKLLDILE